MPVLTSPPIIGGAGKPVTGRVAIIPTATFETGDGSVVTMAVQGGVIRGGQFFDLDGSGPLELVATPEGIGMRIILHLDEQGAQRGEHRASRVVTVPDVSTVAWADLVDVEPPASGGSYIVPAWAAETLLARDDATSAASAATTAAAQADADRVAAETARAGAEAVGTTNDTIIAGQVSAAGSASRAAVGSATVERLFVPEAAKPRRPDVTAMLERFQAGHGWVVFNSSVASAVDDTTDFALGTQSYAFTTKTDNSYGSVQKSGLSIDLTGDMLVLWVKVTGTSAITELAVLAGDSTLTNHYAWTVADAGGREQHVFREGQWAPIVLSFADTGKVGTPNRAAIQMIRIRARATTGNAVTIKLGGIGTASEPAAFPNGVISFACDDSYISQFTEMKRVLDKYGWGATAYTIVENIGQPGFMTEDHLRRLERESGWEVGGHSYSLAAHSAGYGEATPLADTEADIAKLRQWLVERRFRGADHLAYPLGYYSADSAQVMGKYFATGRTVTNRLSETARPSDRMRLRSLSVTNTIPLSTATSLVDRVKANKGWGIITTHSLVTTPTAGTHWSIADFEALVEHAAAAGIPVLPVGEVTKRLNAVEAATPAAIKSFVDSGNQSMGAVVHAALGNVPGTLNAMRREEAATGFVPASGVTAMVCFTPAVDMAITQLAAMTSAAAWTGHTLARLGLYTLSGATATLVAATANDPTLFVAANTVYKRPLSAGGGLPTSYTLLAGQRYAVGVLGVGQSAGGLRGSSVTAALAQRSAILGGTMGAALTDLPSTGSIAVTGVQPWAELSA